MEFFIKLGVQADTIKLSDFVSAVGDLNLKAVLVALRLDGFYKALSNILTIGDQTATSLLNLNAVTGVSTDEIQQLDGVVKKFGGNAGDAAMSIRGVQKSLLDMMLHGKIPEFFQIAGITPTIEDLNKPIEFMQKLAKAFKDVNAPAAIKTQALEALGIPESMIRTIEQVTDLRKEMANIPFADNATLQELSRYHQIIEQLKTTFNSGIVVVAGMLAENLNSIGSAFFGAGKGIDNFKNRVKLLVDQVMTAIGVLSIFFPQLRIPFIASEALLHPQYFGKIYNNVKSEFDKSLFSDYVNLNPAVHGIFGNSGGSVNQTSNVTINAKTNLDENQMKKVVANVLSDVFLQTQQQSKNNIK